MRHDQLVSYLRALAQASDRIQLEEIGRTYEQRPLLMLTISHPDNLKRLEEIRTQHLTLSNPDQKPPVAIESMPVVVNLGYGVHGNESSASNASVLIAYYLAAAQSEEVNALLRNTVILLDPCLNPDGFGRFAQWANSHRGKAPIAHADSREHNEVWPGGRTNHYWFDLNRDWLLAQHPESRARLKKYHAWRPNVLTDFHEMSSESTYFFQPGVEERRNPLTPESNVALTKRFASLHAETLDEIGSLYYTEERFDDFYYGKGSTYPDVHGGVGILFEQASSRGHKRASQHGDFDFAFTIRNQVRTSLSTLKGAQLMRVDLLKHQQEFYQSAPELAKKDEVKGYLFGALKDPASNHALLDLLRRHEIRVHPLRKATNGFQPGSAWIVPTAQPQYRLLTSIFEKRTSFRDSIFYDVSSWNLALAMGIPFEALKEIPAGALDPNDRLTEPSFPSAPAPKESSLAYALEPHGQFLPRALARLHSANARAKVSTKPFTAKTTEGLREFARGTVLIPLGTQETAPREILPILQKIAEKDGVTVHALTSGLTPKGIDLGSPSMHTLTAPKPLLLVGKGVNAYEAGEVWHLLDHRQECEVTLVDLNRFSSTPLSDFTHLLMVDGKYELSDKQIDKIKSWIEQGGILVTTKAASRWASKKKLNKVTFEEDEHEEKKEEIHAPGDAPERRPYDQHEPDRDSKLTKGTIFATDLDLSHPLAYGITSREHAVFRNSNVIMLPSSDPYATVAQYTASPLLAGYAHIENQAKIRNSAALIAQRQGKGVVITFADNPNFRAFWTGTSKTYLNAIFFGSILEETNPKPKEDGDDHGHRH